MRTTRIIAFVVASVMTASVAQAQQVAPAATAGPHTMRHGMGMGRGHGGRGGLMHGIKLSDTEKSKLKVIREKYKAEAKPLRESMKPAMQDARAARQKGDTAAARAAFDRSKADREKARSLMEQERNEIRGALSADNQKQFDANVAQMKQKRDEWEKKGGKGGKRRGFGGT